MLAQYGRKCLRGRSRKMSQGARTVHRVKLLFPGKLIRLLQERKHQFKGITFGYQSLSIMTAVWLAWQDKERGQVKPWTPEPNWIQILATTSYLCDPRQVPRCLLDCFLICTCLIGLSWGFSETTYIRHVEACLAHSKHHKDVCFMSSS